MLMSVALALALLAATVHAWDSNPEGLEQWMAVAFSDDRDNRYGNDQKKEIMLIRSGEAYGGTGKVYAVDAASIRKRMRSGEDRLAAIDKVAVTPFRVIKWKKYPFKAYGYWSENAVEIGIEGRPEFKTDGYVMTMWGFEQGLFDVDGLDDIPKFAFDEGLKRGLLKVTVAQPSEIRKLAWFPLTAALQGDACADIEFHFKKAIPAGALNLDAGFTPSELELMQFAKIAPSQFLGAQDFSAGREAALKTFQTKAGAEAYKDANGYLYGYRGFLASLMTNFAAALSKANDGKAVEFGADESKILACRLRSTGFLDQFKAHADKVGGEDNVNRRAWAVKYWRDFLIEDLKFYAGFNSPEGRGRTYFSLPRETKVNENLAAFRLARTKECVEQFLANKDKCASAIFAETEKMFPKPAPPKAVDEPAAEPVVVKRPADKLDAPAKANGPVKRNAPARKVQPQKTVEDMGKDLCKQMGEC
jgi:hypothetical protein